jgi:hypothetical protein
MLRSVTVLAMAEVQCQPYRSIICLFLLYAHEPRLAENTIVLPSYNRNIVLFKCVFDDPLVVMCVHPFMTLLNPE